MRFSTTPDAAGLVVHAPAKLNLYLEVGGVRPDGFHEIDSLLQAISLYDVLELRPRSDEEISLRDDEVRAGEKNLVYRAAVLLRDRLRGRAGRGAPRGVEIALRKGIPLGGGLGGGSSDAAATLVALLRLWRAEAEVRREELAEIGAELGSDVPFFFHGGTARCQGRGERVTPYHEVFDGATFHYVLVCPGFPVSTRDIYAALDRRAQGGAALTLPSALDSMSPTSTLERLNRGELFFNRLEQVACELVEELRQLALAMRAEGFRAVRMSGSGSTFFGVCRSAEEASVLARRLESRLTATREGTHAGVRVAGRKASGGWVPGGARVLEARSLPGWTRLAGV